MNKNIIFIVTGVLIVSLGAFYFIGGNKKSDDQANGIFALSFTHHNGDQITLNDFAGKALIVNSWATWCPFCVDELPDFVAAQEEFGDEIVIIVINRKESTNQSQKYVEDLGIDGELVYLLDPTDSFYKTIGGFAMPETLFINKKGETIIHKRGPMKIDEIREKIEKII